MFVDDGFSVLDTCGIMAQAPNKAQEVQVEKVDINKHKQPPLFTTQGLFFRGTCLTRVLGRSSFSFGNFNNCASII